MSSPFIPHSGTLGSSMPALLTRANMGHCGASAGAAAAPACAPPAPPPTAQLGARMTPTVRSTPGGTKAKDEAGRDRVDDIRLKVDDIRLMLTAEDERRTKSDHVDETDDERRMNSCTSSRVRLGNEEQGSPRSDGDDCIGGSNTPSRVWLVTREATAANESLVSGSDELTGTFPSDKVAVISMSDGEVFLTRAAMGTHTHTLVSPCAVGRILPNLNYRTVKTNSLNSNCTVGPTLQKNSHR